MISNHKLLFAEKVVIIFPFLAFISTMMKTTTIKNFGNTTKQSLLPLVPEPINVTKKEDLCHAEINGILGQANAPKVRFTFKMLEAVGKSHTKSFIGAKMWNKPLLGLSSNVGYLVATDDKHKYKSLPFSLQVGEHPASVIVSLKGHLPLDTSLVMQSLAAYHAW